MYLLVGLMWFSGHRKRDGGLMNPIGSVMPMKIHP